MAEYTKDTRFSGGWMIGGAVIMWVTNFLGGFIAGGVGVTSDNAILGIVLGCFAVGGFVVGHQSEGRTIIEAGLGAILAIVASMFVTYKGLVLDLPLKDYVIGFGPPFAAAIVGAFIGEKVQGDVIVTKDD